MEEKCWTTKNGDVIPISDLEDSPLDNIIRYIERLAKNGMVVSYGGGHFPEEMWYDEEMVYGKDVYREFPYEELLKEKANRANGS